MRSQLCLALLFAAAAATASSTGGMSNSLCSKPPEGMVGAYSPADTSAVPEGVADSVAQQFLSNATYSDQPFTGCTNYSATVLQACSQVVAGTNWQLLVAIQCTAGAWSNGVEAAVVEATVFQPLPYTNQPPQVTSAELQGVEVAAPQPAENELCASTGMPGGYSPANLSAIPAEVTELVIEGIANITAATDCTDYTLSIPQACSQVVSGSNWWLSIKVECLEGSLLLGLPALNLQAVVYTPLPASNQAPSITRFDINLVDPAGL